MKIFIELEDTFADIMRKATKGTAANAQRVAQGAGIDGQTFKAFLAEEARPTQTQAESIAAALHLDPKKFADIALGRWKPQERDLAGYIGHQVNRPHPSNGYFIIEKQHNAAAFVDPGGNADNIMATLQRSGTGLQYVLLTHKHPDHVDALPALRNAFPQAKVVIHKLDARALGRMANGMLEVEDGETLPFADDQIRLVHTPGHTDGSSCFTYKESVFTGDTLFAGSVGGLFGDNFGYAELLQNIRTKLFALPPDTAVLPGHGPPSTVGEERRHNPFFAS